MEIAVYAGALAAIVSCCNHLWYLSLVIRGRVVPHVFPYLVWGTTCAVVFASMLKADVTYASWRMGLSAVLSYVGALISLRNGLGYVRPVDYVAAALAFGAIPIWYFTEQPDTAVFVVLAAEVIGGIPAIRKAYERPTEDSAWMWFWAMAGQLLSLAALDGRSLTHQLYFIIWASVSFTAMCALWFSPHRRGKRLAPPASGEQAPKLKRVN